MFLFRENKAHPYRPLSDYKERGIGGFISEKFS
jgi:hypothetical protein